jgi:hypothetical protein
MLLLDDLRIVPGTSPETPFDQQVMQFNEPDIATRGAPISIPAQATGSSIYAAITVTTPAAAST